MPRNLDTATLAQLDSHDVRVAMFLQVTFRSGIYHLSTLPCSFTWGGNTWIGTGSLGRISTIEEGIDVNARGINVSLSGIDSTLVEESLADIKVGASAKLFLGFFAPDSLTLITTPICLFAGIVDSPSITMSDQSATISLNLESSLIRLQRASNLMLTPSDQKILYPDDTGLDSVNLLNWQALRWGS